ncbi:MAG: ABC transporter permease subunit [Actinomycetota bacterium]
MAANVAARPAERGRMLGNVAARTLRYHARALRWWALGTVGYILMYTSVWPSVRDNAAAYSSTLESMPEAVRNLIGTDFGTPAGYLRAEMFTFVTPILMLIYAIGMGTRGLAGEEEAGTLDMLLATPVRRRRIVLDKFVAMAAGTAFLSGLTWVGVALLGPPFDLHVSLVSLAAAAVDLGLFALGFGAIGMALGAATGSRSLALGASSGLALVAFLIHTLAPSVHLLRPMRKATPLYFFLGHDPLTNGFNLLDLTVLTAIPLAALVFALWFFERRDLAV